MPIVAHKGEVAPKPECLIPILILEELVNSDRPMSVAEMSECLGIGKPILQSHLLALEEQEFIQSSGSQSAFVLGRRLVMLCAALNSGDLI